MQFQSTVVKSPSDCLDHGLGAYDITRWTTVALAQRAHPDATSLRMPLK
jgi:hypothetical protein